MCFYLSTPKDVQEAGLLLTRWARHSGPPMRQIELKGGTKRERREGREGVGGNWRLKLLIEKSSVRYWGIEGQMRCSVLGKQSYIKLGVEIRAWVSLFL